MNNVQNNQVNDVQIDREYACHISCDSSSTICVNVGGVKLEMLVDSGATSNIISEDTWEELKTQKIL